jgi:hypothetical protein
MATVADSAPSTSTPARTKGYPLGGVRFDAIFVLLSAWLLGGLAIDGWAHTHGKVDTSFFTPWHAIFYSGFMAVALFLFVNQWRNLSRGYPLRRALPAGYELSLVGAAVFAVGGVGDMIWHTLFGIESELAETLLSPTHLLLAIGMFLITSGPLRAAWFRPERTGGWRSLAPMLFSATLIWCVLSFFTAFAHPFTEIYAIESPWRSNAYLTQNNGVASIILQSVVLSGVILLLVRRWTLPFGALTLMMTVSSLIMCVFQDYFSLIPGVFVAGLISDILLNRLQPSLDNPSRFYSFAFLLPVVFYALYFISLQLTQGRIGWSIHLWTGSAFIAGIAGLLVSFLIISPFHAPDLTPNEE